MISIKLAVIPARGGSKRIPRKNVKIFGGKPIIAWSIEAALKSGCFDRVIVSTDDPEIAEVSRKWGAETPFIRPAELSQDHTATIPVIRHAIEWFIEHDETPDITCCIYATAPFIRTEDLRRGLDVLLEENSDYAFSVTSFPFPIQRAVKITSDGRLEMFQPECFNVRSQDLDEAYHDAGQFYWGRSDAWIKEKVIFSHNAAPLVLPRYRVQDIDTAEDWIRAEMMFELLKTLKE